jgi:hypothetical protein
MSFQALINVAKPLVKLAAFSLEKRPLAFGLWSLIPFVRRMVITHSL